jgi:class 3 adenylate cyclase
MRRRDWVVAVLTALALGAGVSLASRTHLQGLSLDLLFLARQSLLGRPQEAAQSPSVIMALDEETYRRPPFAGLPNVMWTPEIARVLNAVVDGGATVVGMDVIFPTAVERYLPGFDRDFLLALRNGGRQGKIVLGAVQHQEFPIAPFQGQIIAVGGPANLRSVNLFLDPDDVIRRIPLTFESQAPSNGTRTQPSMALELAARALGAKPERTADGGLALADYRIPGSESNTMAINFAGADAIPTYSLADLAACAADGNAAFFHRNFAGKVVLVGAVLDVEDRKLTSMRYITAPEHPSTGERCKLPPMTELFRGDLVRDSVPGVYVLASAVNDLIRRDAFAEPAPAPVWTLTLAFAFASAAAAMALRAGRAALLVAAVGALWVVLAALAFGHGVVLPLLAPPVAGGLVLAVSLGYRFAVTDRDKRFLRQSFSLYLAPALVERMLAAERPPELGGELRTVTVLFSDLQDFTALSERTEPGRLVAIMNAYLSAMTEIIEREGGIVDKYIGDAIVAIFGAPLDDAEHAGHAVRAALACRDRLEQLNADPAVFSGARLRTRIGLSTGPAVVGNVGSQRRFNYTAMGDTVNVAARLEAANKTYGTTILASAAVRNAAGAGFRWREIGRIQVKGRADPLTVFEPETDADDASLRRESGGA